MENVFGGENEESRKVASFRRFHRRVLSSTKGERKSLLLLHGEPNRRKASKARRRSEENHWFLSSTKWRNETGCSPQRNRLLSSVESKEISGLSRIEGKGLLIFFGCLNPSIGLVKSRWFCMWRTVVLLFVWQMDLLCSVYDLCYGLWDLIMRLDCFLYCLDRLCINLHFMCIDRLVF